jgi:hypothetical protein
MPTGLPFYLPKPRISRTGDVPIRGLPFDQLPYVQGALDQEQEPPFELPLIPNLGTGRPMTLGEIPDASVVGRPQPTFLEGLGLALEGVGQAGIFDVQSDNPLETFTGSAFRGFGAARGIGRAVEQDEEAQEQAIIDRAQTDAAARREAILDELKAFSDIGLDQARTEQIYDRMAEPPAEPSIGRYSPEGIEAAVDIWRRTVGSRTPQPTPGQRITPNAAASLLQSFNEIRDELGNVTGHRATAAQITALIDKMVKGETTPEDFTIFDEAQADIPTLPPIVAALPEGAEAASGQGRITINQDDYDALLADGLSDAEIRELYDVPEGVGTP